jgi:hypothetical protein
MTSGWTGDHYAGIPAGTVGPVDTMQPAPALLGAFPPADTPGLSYFFMRGEAPSYGGLSGDPLYTKPSLVPAGCALKGCGVPPMEYCRTLQCPRGSAPFQGVGCVAPGAGQ